MLLKNIFGLSKFCRSSSLMSVLKIKSITKLYDKYKILFLRQIKRNSFTKEIFEILHHRYTAHVIPPKESYFSIIKDMNNKYDLNIDVKMHHNDIKGFRKFR